jgi:hypothetical protein
MAEAPILYTGKGLSAKLPDTSGAMNRLTDFITKADEIRYKAFKDNKEWFLKQMEVDPVAFLTTANQDAQARAMKEYNEAASLISKEAGGLANLSGEAQTKILAAKNVLISKQNEMKADMAQYLLEKETVDKDGGVNYDPVEVYNTKFAPYLNGEKYNRTPLQPKAKPIEAVVKGTISGVGAYSENDPNNPSQLRMVSASKKDVAPQIVDVIMSNQAVKRHALQEWDSLGEEGQKAYLDLNKDNIVSEEERKAGSVLARSLDNPIIRSYVDKHWGNLVDVKFKNKQKGKSDSTTQDKGVPTRVSGATVNIFPGEKVGVRTYGGNVYSANSYGFGGNTTLYGIPTAGATLLTGKWADEVDPGSVNARLVLYDPEKRVFLIETTSGSESAMTASKVLLEVPESSITNSENIPLMDNGKQTTVGSVRGTQASSKPVVNIGL